MNIAMRNHTPGFSNNDPYEISADKWLNDVTMWPKIEYPDLFNYLVNSKGSFDAKCLKNYRSLAAYDYVISGKVQQVYVYCPDSPLQKFRILGADVQPSQRIRNEVLKTWVIATKEGTVQMAHCTCMAGFGETCSHVAAVLFKIELVVRTGATRQGSTEALCTWNNKFSNTVTSLPMTEIDLRKRKWNADEKARKVNVLPRKNVPPLSPMDIAEIKAVQPNAVYFTSYVSDSSETDSASDDEVNLPLTLVDLFKSSASVINSDSIKVHFSAQNCKSLEEATKSQESLWKQHKAGRLTSSNFGVVLKRKKWSDEFADSVLFPKEISYVPAIKWGKSKEKIAVQYYVESTKSNHVNFEYEPAGLHIAPNDPHLGASPDGKINCSCCGKGVIEVKCPFKHKECDPKLISTLDRTFCLDENNELKVTHNYYYQVQGQMFLCDVNYCDFVIWTKKGFIVHRVYKDLEFWEANKPILDDIYYNMCVPFLVKKFMA